MNKKGKLFLLMGPSGVGKGTATRHLRATQDNVFFPTSYTTRSMRQGEKDGETYNFITKPEFEKMIKQDAFLEYQLVHKTNYYGTDKQTIIDNINSGKVVLREMDLQGVQDVLSKQWPFEIKTIFITTDSWETLEQRIRQRSEISEQELANRKQSFQKEMEYLEKADYVVYSIQGEIDEMIESLISIINK